MKVYAKLPAGEILPLLGKDKPRHTFGCFKVKVGTLRLQLFKNNHICVRCGIEGVIFHLEKNRECKYEEVSPHLNLYGIDGDELILMTQDHIIPRSRGGPDELENLQTMCFRCNEAKGNKEEI